MNASISYCGIVARAWEKYEAPDLLSAIASALVQVEIPDWCPIPVESEEEHAKS